MTDEHRPTLSVPKTVRLPWHFTGPAYEYVVRAELPAIRLGRPVFFPRRAIQDQLRGADDVVANQSPLLTKVTVVTMIARSLARDGNGFKPSWCPRRQLTRLVAP
jgi:hypothetical protein